MIKQFNDAEARTSGIVYQSSLEQIKKMHARNPARAGELAIMIIELTLTGQHSSDDEDLDIMVETSRAVAARDAQKYVDKQEQKQAKQIADLQLDKIAEMYNAGYSQVKIGEILGEKKQTINYRINVIRKNYPHLLNESKSQTSTNVQNLTNESKMGGSQILTESKNQMGQIVQNLTEESKILTEDFDGQTELLGASKILTENLTKNGQKVKQVQSYVNVNVNVNDNVNETRVSSNEETLETISLEELNRMGAEYTLDDEGIATFSTGHRAKVKFEF